ncbi:MAG: hypothetical protein AUJ20_09480 [Comamonadaceae bacterium CG1_02_60_18]|nr:MAG: hypothetical protein AUJ20_09480 [Comamonadaceae bacterium CG1_02_60_18]PIQ53662.1 MAG: hypothetical protein COW02_06480 [Comamonadaceae bacterium CG12_big_fil_rev_8_21_14_0_65_59_15]
MSPHEPIAPRLLALGDSAWTVEFGNHIDAQLNARVIGLAQAINALRQDDPNFACVTDVVPAFCSVTVHFDPLACNAEQLGQNLLALSHNTPSVPANGHHWYLPLCFDTEFAPDLPALAQAKGLSQEAIKALLLGAQFRVFMIGFLPGFPYMGGLPAELAMPRLATPRTRVPAHSVAVAGDMCAIYPWDSPGGWNLLGRTPVQLFSLANEAQHSMLSSGDVVNWYSIDRPTYDQLLQRGTQGQLPRETFLQRQHAPCPV